MRYSSILATTLLVLFVGSPAVFGQQSEHHEVEKIEVPDIPDGSGKRPDLGAAAKTIIEQTNAFRKKESQKAVTTADNLTDTAKFFAEYMARTDEYGHRADGSNPGERVKKYGYMFCMIEENIAYSFDSRGFETDPLATKFVTGWETSPPHRKNMLDPDVTETGVAVARSEKTGVYYAVQLFGRPMSAAVVFKVENRSDEDVKYTIGDQTFKLPPRMTRTHTRCRPAELTFEWHSGKTATAKIASGDHLRVTKTGDQFTVKKV